MHPLLLHPWRAATPGGRSGEWAAAADRGAHAGGRGPPRRRAAPRPPLSGRGGGAGRVRRGRRGGGAGQARPHRPLGARAPLHPTPPHPWPRGRHAPYPPRGCMPRLQRLLAGQEGRQRPAQARLGSSGRRPRVQPPLQPPSDRPPQSQVTPGCHVNVCHDPTPPTTPARTPTVPPARPRPAQPPRGPGGDQGAPHLPRNCVPGAAGPAGGVTPRATRTASRAGTPPRRPAAPPHPAPATPAARQQLSLTPGRGRAPLRPCAGAGAADARPAHRAPPRAGGPAR
jgi:translation initiation factor IF-2